MPVDYNDEDILYYNGTSWVKYFDGSDVGAGNLDLNAFYIMSPNTILMTFSKSAVLNGVQIDEWDIALFTATSLGENTAGTFSIYFDGEDVGLSSPGEDIDAIARLETGQLVISTLGSPSVNGVSGAKDEDLLIFTPTSLGTNTAGTWAMYFDGSDVGISGGSDVNGLAITPNGDLDLTTDNTVVLTLVLGTLTVENEDVFICRPISLGENTACEFLPNLFFDGSNFGLDSNDVFGISLP